MNCFEELMKVVKNLKGENRARAVNDFLDKHPECEGGWTLSEIGKILGLTRERVRQIEASAIKKLRHPKMGRILKSLLLECK